MRISVIVPTYNRPNDLPRIFNSLLNQEEPAEEILAITGPGDQESISVCNSWMLKLPGLQVFESSKPSVIHSINLGLSLAKGDIICLVDDDVFLPEGWSRKIRQTFNEDSIVGAFGGRDILQLEDPQYSRPKLASTVGMFNWRKGLIGNHHCGASVSPDEVDVLKGCNLSFIRSAFPTMKIDENLKSFGAETCWEIDLCQKIKSSGYKLIYDNENYVLHFASPRLAADNRIDIFSPSWPRRIYNEAYIMGKFRPYFEVTCFCIRTFCIGSRYSPGIVWSLLLLKKYGIKVFALPWSFALSITRGVIKGYSSRSISN